MRPFLPTFIFILLAGYAPAQNITGSWFGKADVIAPGLNSNYLTEFVLKQKGKEVEGIFGYYFKDSYQSFFIRGTYNSKTREVHIKNLPMLFYKSDTRNGIECPMHFQGIVMVSQVNSSIRGSFYTEDRYKYTCPELRVNFSMDNTEQKTDSILQHTVAGKKYWQPQEEDFVVTNLTSNQSVKLTADAQASGAQSADSLTSVADDEMSALIARFEKRKTVYTMDLEVESDSVRLSFYDNGDVDGDSISVFIDRKPALVKQELTARALNIYVTLDSTKALNEITMFAENLGKLPPNTALMVVTDGVNRHEVYLSSSLTQNAGIRLKRKKK